MQKRSGTALFFSILVCVACKGIKEPVFKSPGSRPPLSFLSLSQSGSSPYEEHALNDFGQRHQVAVQYLPAGGDSVDSQLALYREIFRHRYSQPDILMIDTIWPGLLAPDLIDLRPFLSEAIAASTPVEIQNNTVDGRVVAIPMFIDYGVLYYRPSLLKRYGFRRPPETWDQLESMARTIQDGERGTGNRDFWGYGWPAGNDESLTCGTLEWFLSNGGASFVEPDGTVRVNTPENIAAVQRAKSWIGMISPPGVPLYHESDVENLWRSGQVAFARGWVNTFTASDSKVGNDELPFEIAPVPAGRNGHFGVLGDLSLAISKYAANRDLAIQALQEFTGERPERQRLVEYALLPTRSALFGEPETFRHTFLRNATAQRSLQSLAIRPSTLLGKRYDMVTREVSENINSVLSGRVPAAVALADLQSRVEATMRRD